MIRVMATLCFSLTLLCPIVCLAGTDADCPDRDAPSGGNCEAMSIGAVVEKSVSGPVAPCRLLPSFDRPSTDGSSAVDARRRSHLTAWNRDHSQPPPSTRRHALLQTFLF